MSMRVGVIGCGGIGRAVADDVAANGDMELTFVCTRTPRTLDSAAPRQSVTFLDEQLLNGVDLVVEAAHPHVLGEYGAMILRQADLMALSASALAEDSLRNELIATACTHGRRLMLPHGALVGLESLAANPAVWREVSITFIKHPENIDPRPQHADQRVTVYDGAARGVAALYPRNVNAMVTCALATTGLDACRAQLISDPARTSAVLEIHARGADGSLLNVRKEQPMRGVSGTEMAASVLHSLRGTTGSRPGLTFV